MKHWPTRQLPNTHIPVGPCAWAFTLTLESAHAQYLNDHPSLIVIGPDDLAQAPSSLPRHALDTLARMPLALHIREPEFIRHLPATIEKTLAALGRTHVDVVILHAQELADIKSGSAIQSLSGLRDQGKLRTIGLSAPTALDAEWLAGISSARMLSVPFGIDDQLVRHRALPALLEFSMDAIAQHPLTAESSAPNLAVRFALAMSSLVLPILATPLDESIEPLPADEAEAIWQIYALSHPPPPPLPRSRPPE